MEVKFDVIFLEDAIEFIESVDLKARAKIFYNIERAKEHNDPKLFKKLTNEIWEFRTLYKETQYRLFAFWDKNRLVIATHGIIKKTDKIAEKDFNKAEKLRKDYFESLKNK